jgi:hypothetical protein
MSILLHGSCDLRDLTHARILQQKLRQFFDEVKSCGAETPGGSLDTRVTFSQIGRYANQELSKVARRC